MEFPESSYRHVSYNRREKKRRYKQEARLMDHLSCGYSDLHKEAVDTLDRVIATKHLI